MKKISTFLKNNPCGNYALALENGVDFVENIHSLSLKQFALSLCKKDDIFIEQGIANLEAQYGYMELAQEIQMQSQSLKLDFDIFYLRVQALRQLFWQSILNLKYLLALV